MTVKTTIGGAPVTQPFADQIGANGCSTDAPGAVKRVKLLGGLINNNYPTSGGRQ